MKILEKNKSNIISITMVLLMTAISLMFVSVSANADDTGVYLDIFDTGPSENPYPCIFGTHNGTIKPNVTIAVSKIYTYPCSGTGGHVEYAKIYNDSWSIVTLPWERYTGDWHNLTFSDSFKLSAGETYNYTIIAGSYPQIHHTPALETAYGWINCSEFVDANGKRYNNWIPAIRLEGEAINISKVLQKSIEYLGKEQYPTGEWRGEISSNCFGTAPNVITLLDYGGESPNSTYIQKSVSWLINNQNEDGGWGSSKGGNSRLDTTILVVLALNKSGILWNDTIIESGLDFIDENGGFDKAQLVAKSYLAANGFINWTQVETPFPIECILDPMCFGSLSDKNQFAKITVYSIELRKKLHQNNNHSTIERTAMNKTIEWLILNHYPDGSWDESAGTYWVFATLMDAGVLNDTEIDKTIAWIKSRQRIDGGLSCFLDLRVTDASLTLKALRSAGLSKSANMINNGTNYLINMQNEDGGWGWTIYVPSDLDDTALATSALIDAGISKDSDIINKSISHLLVMQDSSGGWRTYSNSPFADPLSTDVTSRVIIALIKSGITPNSTEIQRGIDWLLQQQSENGTWTGVWWIGEVYGTSYAIQALLAANISPTTPELHKAIDWLNTNQHLDGGWGPENMSTTEDTSLAICALLESGESPCASTIQKGISWLVTNQNSDGSWSPAHLGLLESGESYSDTMFANAYAVDALGEYKDALISNRSMIDQSIKGNEQNDYKKTNKGINKEGGN